MLADGEPAITLLQFCHGLVVVFASELDFATSETVLFCIHAAIVVAILYGTKKSGSLSYIVAAGFFALATGKPKSAFDAVFIDSIKP